MKKFYLQNDGRSSAYSEAFMCPCIRTNQTQQEVNQHDDDEA